MLGFSVRVRDQQSFPDVDVLSIAHPLLIVRPVGVSVSVSVRVRVSLRVV